LKIKEPEIGAVGENDISRVLLKKIGPALDMNDTPTDWQVLLTLHVGKVNEVTKYPDNGPDEALEESAVGKCSDVETKIGLKIPAWGRLPFMPSLPSTPAV
jgi:hypothetical protein